jgi:proline iminopeptidase
VHAKVNGTTIFFDVCGLQYEPRGEKMVEKPVTFVLHGGPGMDHTYFLPWVKPLEQYTQMIFPDHRSTGMSTFDSGPETWNIEQFADDVEELRKLLGLGKITLMGSSFGGMWSLVYTTRYPYNVERLILVDTAPSWAANWKAAQKVMNAKANKQQKKVATSIFEGKVRNQEQFKAWWDVMLPLYFHKYDDKIGREMIQRGIGSPLLSATMFQDAIPKYDVESKLKFITAPTLILVGRDDWITPPSSAQTMAKLIPDSKLVVFEKSGHMPFIEEQAKFLKVVGDFYKQAR